MPSRDLEERPEEDEPRPESPSQDPAGAISWLPRLLFRGKRQGSMTPLKAEIRAEDVDLEVEKKKKPQRRQKGQNNDERPKFRRCKSLPISAADHSSQNVPRRPSIPSSIHDEDGSSVVSEVTLVTYSAEKVEAVRREFFQRMRLMAEAVGHDDFTIEEKEAVLRQVQAEQEEAWRYSEMRAKLFARRMMKDKQDEYEDLDDGYWHRDRGTAEDHIDESEVARGIEPLDQSSTSSPNLDQSDVTREVTNGRGRRNIKNAHSEVDHPRQPSSVISERDSMAGEVKSESEHTPQASSLPSYHESEATRRSEVSRSCCSSSRRARIDDVIELKLMVANQRAAIDALSMRLRSLEVDNRRHVAQEGAGACRIRGLEEENRRLGRELEAQRRRCEGWEDEHHSSRIVVGEHNRRPPRHHLSALDISSRSEPPPTKSWNAPTAAATINTNINPLADFLIRLGSSSLVESSSDDQERLARENSDLRRQVEELRVQQQQHQQGDAANRACCDGKHSLETQAIGATVTEAEVPAAIRFE